MAQEQLQRRDPKTLRDARSGEIVVLNKREDRVYQLGNPTESTFGASYLEAIGWHFIDRKTDKERVRGGGPSKDDPSKESYSDQLLMWIEKDLYEGSEQLRFQEQQRLLYRTTQKGGIDAVMGSDGHLAGPFGQKGN